MIRWLVVAVTAALLAGPAPAEASGCVLATDPAGDAESLDAPTAGPQHDIRRVTTEVTAKSLVFHITVQGLSPTTPPPATGDDWSVWFTAPDGEIQSFVHRTYRRDFASVAGSDGTPPGSDVYFRIDSKSATVTSEVPYSKIGLRRGDRLTDIRAYAGPYQGLDLGVGDNNGLIGTSSLVDEAASSKSIVVGVGCR